MSNQVIIKDAVKRYGDFTALNGVSLDIREGEFFTLLGPSGCGKTTTLRMIGGFETPDQGDILFLGERINDIPPHKRNINTVFQRYALFPHLNVFENVAFPLSFRGVPYDKRMRLAKKALKDVGLESHMNHMPGQMSGGQQQRVGIARALVTDPDIIFADEPTGNLDSKTSDDVMRSMCDTVKSHGKTFIMVTHDPNMAAYADKVINILDGRITDIYFNRHETVGDKAEIREEIKKEA
mgnify:CR=1 FL=1